MDLVDDLAHSATTTGLEQNKRFKDRKNPKGFKEKNRRKSGICTRNVQ